MIPAIVEPLAVPPIVRRFPAPEIVPVFYNVIVPFAEMMLEALPNVSRPGYVAAVALEFTNAPPDAIPVPLIVKGLVEETV